jgi:predicted short-subunit dehydrogenase-like oxidoreductase (DUF2520 family)
MQSTIAIVGRGRLGPALAAALDAAGRRVLGPLGRGADGAGADVVLLCVPDAEIGAAARAVTTREGLIVGHCSGATGLDVLRPHEALGLHPLMTVTHAGATLAGAGCAIGGSTLRALHVAESLAAAVGMRPFPVADDDRAAYHAAASIASNFVVTLEWMAERVAAAAGIAPEDARKMLVPLVRQTVDNWASVGPQAALTGPVARGDEVTVARQRKAIADAAPDLLPLFDALVDQTRELAA